MISRRQNMEVGVVLALVLLIVGLVSGALLWCRIAVAVLLITVLVPIIYTPLSWLWFGFARLAECFFSTIILILIFYLIVTPVAVLRRWLSGDALSLHCFKKDAQSVFVTKDKTYKAEDLEKQY